MSTNAEIGERLIDWGVAKYGNKKNFAPALGWSNQATLNNYVGENASQPGPMIRKRLRELGADVDYILTGRSEFQELTDTGNKALFGTVPVNNSDSEIALLKKLYEEKVVQGDVFKKEITELRARIAELEAKLGVNKPKAPHGYKHVSEFDLEDEVEPSGIKIEPEKPIHVVPLRRAAATPIIHRKGSKDEHSDLDSP